MLNQEAVLYFRRAYVFVSITFIQYIGDSIHFKTSLFTYLLLTTLLSWVLFQIKAVYMYTECPISAGNSTLKILFNTSSLMGQMQACYLATARNLHPQWVPSVILKVVWFITVRSLHFYFSCAHKSLRYTGNYSKSWLYSFVVYSFFFPFFFFKKQTNKKTAKI